MPYEISFDQKDNIVIARVFGMATHDEHHSAQEEAFILCNEKNCSGILVDLHDLDTAKSDSVTCFDSGEFVAKAPIPLATRIAHVMPANQKSRKNVEFVLTVAANRGRYSGQFKTFEEAKNWLLH